MALETSTTLWSDDYEQEVIGYLKKEKTGQNFDLASMGGVEQVVRRSNGKYMSTKSRALNVMQLLHRETGHAGEHKTLKKIKDTYDNITRNFVGMFLK